MSRNKKLFDSFKPLREAPGWRQLHNAKVSVCRWLLETLEPDQKTVIRQSVKQALDVQQERFDVALLSIQAEVDEAHGGGLLHGVPSVAALCAKIREQRRELNALRWRTHKLVRLTGVDFEGQLTHEVGRLVSVDNQREAEIAKVREAVRLARQAREADSLSLALMYDLERRYDEKENS